MASRLSVLFVLFFLGCLLGSPRGLAQVPATYQLDSAKTAQRAVILREAEIRNRHIPIYKRTTVATPTTGTITPKLPAAVVHTGIEGSDSKVIVTAGPATAQAPMGVPDKQETTLSTDNTPSQRCITKRVSFTDVNQDFTEFATAAGDESWLYPGSLLDLGSVLRGAYRTYNSDRNPITLATTLLGGSVSERVANPTGPSVMQARSNLVTRSNQRNIPARLNAKISKVVSQTDLNVAVYGKYKTTGLDVALSSSLGMNKQKEYYLIDFTQIAYNAFIEDLPGAAAFVTLPTGADPGAMAYINNVVYGRRAIMVVETSDRSTDFSAKLKAAVDQGVSSGEFSGELDYKKFMGNLNINVLIYGGNQATGLRAVSFNVQEAMAGFKAYILSRFTSDRMSEAVPIGYSLKLLATNDRCTVKTIYEMPVENCVPLVGDKALAIRITGVKAHKGEDSDKVEDYRLNVAANYQVNRRATDFLEKHFTGRLTNGMQTRIGQVTNNSLVNYDEGNQLRVAVNTTASVQTEGVLPLRPAGETARYDLVLTTSMCERTGSGCSGMVPLGGKLTPLNVDAIIDILTGASEISKYPAHTLEGDPEYHILGDGYSPMKAVMGNTTQAPPTKLKSRVWTTNRNGRQAFIYFEVELVDTPGLAR